MNEDVTFPEVLPNQKVWTMLLTKEAIRRSEGNQAKAAKLLGITRQAINLRMNKWHKDDKEDLP